MRDFPWIEALLIIALAIALIVRPQNKASAGADLPAIQSPLPR